MRPQTWKYIEKMTSFFVKKYFGAFKVDVIDVFDAL